MAAEAAPERLRLALDAQATVKVGPFARGGKSRSKTMASDPDFKPEARVTLVGIFLPATDALFVDAVTSKVTRDGLLDCLLDCLGQGGETVHDRFAHITPLVINWDNGPENHSRRTPFRQRVVEFVRPTPLTVRLAYYPPYPSQHNPIERCWGLLENHGDGSILDTVEAVVQFTARMTWPGLHPVVELITAVYETGVTLTKAGRDWVEAQITRLPGLGKWFIDIAPPALRVG